MEAKLTDLQLRILRALREDKKKDSSVVFSMDDFYDNLGINVEIGRFREDVEILRDQYSYIRQFASATWSDKYHLGGYEITAAGLECLRALDG